MSIIHLRRMGRIADPTEEASPGRGESIVRSIPDDEKGIRFEIGRMVRYVRDYRADPKVVKLARRIVQLCAAKDRLCEMKGLFLWTKGHFRYINDPVNGEAIMTAPAMIADIETPPEVIEAILGPDLVRQMQGFGIGAAALTPPSRIECRGCFRDTLSGAEYIGKTSEDCDSGAIFLGTMLAAIGIVPRFQFGGFAEASGDPNYHHVWVAGKADNGDWIDMDITEEKSTLGWSYPFQARGHVDIFTETG